MKCSIHRLPFTNQQIQYGDIYHPIFDKYHVDLMLQAHSHNYQRTYPIKYNDNDASHPIISDKNEGEIYQS